MLEPAKAPTWSPEERKWSDLTESRKARLALVFRITTTAPTVSAGLPRVRGSAGPLQIQFLSHSGPFPIVAPFTLDHVQEITIIWGNICSDPLPFSVESLVLLLIYCISFLIDPFILPHQQVDKGAIKFVLSGANIMCPGLTSPGAKLYPAAVDTIVAIMAEGKQHALCVGVMKMSAEDIEKVNKGIGIENIHYLNDGLWHMKTYK
ncbi:PREDICTED: uncharacterized protein LOC108534999 [Rhinopithecus bieti]|uniref:uncharacterized protein LOC108534999 n=1 Tax=Rhinopithecus bieti TaxID=61621 RepID=UPI00083C7DC9|nr:PREDICTED: uncharacterized protein LOC108534999 [Rhinopithecus bieti]